MEPQVNRLDRATREHPSQILRVPRHGRPHHHPAPRDGRLLFGRHRLDAHHPAPRQDRGSRVSERRYRATCLSARRTCSGSSRSLPSIRAPSSVATTTVAASLGSASAFSSPLAAPSFTRPPTSLSQSVATPAALSFSAGGASSDSTAVLSIAHPPATGGSSINRPNSSTIASRRTSTPSSPSRALSKRRRMIPIE